MKKLWLCSLALLFLLTGCGKAQDGTVPTTGAVLAVTEAAEPAATEPGKVILPFTQAVPPEEPVWRFPGAIRNRYEFGCEVVNNMGVPAAIHSMEMRDYRDGQEIACRTYTGKSLRELYADAAGYQTIDPCGVANVRPVATEWDIQQFQQRIITITLRGDDGREDVQTFYFTTNPDEVSPNPADGEIWVPVLYQPDYDSWLRNYPIINFTDETLHLKALYGIWYHPNGTPVNAWYYDDDYIGNDRNFLNRVAMLAPGRCLFWQDGMGAYREGRTKVVLIYEDEQGNVYPQTFRFEESRDNDTLDPAKWIVPDIQNGSWQVNLLLQNDSDEALTLDGIYRRSYRNCEAITPVSPLGVLGGTADSFTGEQLEELCPEPVTLAPGDSQIWQETLPVATTPFVGREYTIRFRSEDGKHHYQTYLVGFPEEVARQTDYASVVYWDAIPASSGEPRFTKAEIQQMIDEELTLDQVSDKISTIADLMQYLYLKGFGPAPGGDIKYTPGGITWHFNRSAQTVFYDNNGNCGGSSNLANYILRGDYEEQGYVYEAQGVGGHIINYFVKDGTYYFLDLTTYVGFEDVAVWSAPSLEAFAERHVEENHLRFQPETYYYIHMLYANQMEGEGHIPMGNNGSHPAGHSYFGYLPSAEQDAIKILYMEGGKYTPIFVEAPPPGNW